MITTIVLVQADPKTIPACATALANHARATAADRR